LLERLRLVDANQTVRATDGDEVCGQRVVIVGCSTDGRNEARRA
jgi:hypothetical protein